MEKKVEGNKKKNQNVNLPMKSQNETWGPILTTKGTTLPSFGMLCTRANTTFLLQGFCCK